MTKSPAAAAQQAPGIRHTATKVPTTADAGSSW